MDNKYDTIKTKHALKHFIKCTWDIFFFWSCNYFLLDFLYTIYMEQNINIKTYFKCKLYIF